MAKCRKKQCIECRKENHRLKGIINILKVRVTPADGTAINDMITKALKGWKK